MAHRADGLNDIFEHNVVVREKLTSESVNTSVLNLLENGTAVGQIAFWDGTKWVHTETSELCWDDTNKRFGIGTATPATKLAIPSGTVLIGDNFSYTFGRVLIRGLGTTSSTWAFNVTNSNGTKTIISARDDGHVGIGTTAPDAMLDIVQNSASVKGLQITGAANRSASLLDLKEGSGTSTSPFMRLSSASGTADVFLINNTHRIVAYSQNDNYWQFQGRAASSTNWHGNFWDNYRSRGTHTAPAACQADDYIFYFDSWGHDGTEFQRSARIMEFVDGAVSTGVVPMGIKLSTGTNTSNVLTRMLITSAGNVGIGTTTPATSAILDITSTTGALVVPRMTTAQRDALTALDGMIIYNTSTTAFNFYENGGWVTGSGLV